MADDDRIIRFPGPGAKPPSSARHRKAAPVAAPGGPIDPEQLSDDQKKALQIILSGMSFVFVGINPTPTGADFFTAVHGDEAELRNAAPHLAGVIERAYTRKGL